MLHYLIKYRKTILMNLFLDAPKPDGVVVLDIQRLAIAKRKAMS